MLGRPPLPRKRKKEKEPPKSDGSRLLGKKKKGGGVSLIVEKRGVTVRGREFLGARRDGPVGQPLRRGM